MSQYYKGQIDIYKEMICVACRHVLVVMTVGIRVACVNNSDTFTKVCLPVSGQREHSVHSHEVSVQEFAMLVVFPSPKPIPEIFSVRYVLVFPGIPFQYYPFDCHHHH